MPRKKLLTTSNENPLVEITSNNTAANEISDLTHSQTSEENSIQVNQSDDKEVPVYAGSIEASLGYKSLIRHLNEVFGNNVAYYRSERGGSLSMDEAVALAYRTPDNKEEAKELYDKLMRFPIHSLEFNDLAQMWSVAPQRAQFIWELMKVEAKHEIESGHLASRYLMPIHTMRSAWNLACYIGMRDALVEDWKPRGAMEINLIDMMAQAFFQYQYWLRESVLRNNTPSTQESPEFIEWQKKKYGKPSGFKPGFWDVPSINKVESIEHAMQLVDRWNRIYKIFKTSSRLTSLLFASNNQQPATSEHRNRKRTANQCRKAKRIGN